MTRAQLTAIVWEEDGVFVSKCPEIEVSSAGDTADEAFENLKEAIDLWLENAQKLDIIDDYLPMMTSPSKSTRIIEINV